MTTTKHPHGWGRTTGASPGAIARDLRCSGEVLVALVERNLRVRLKRTVLGIGVPLVSPLLMLVLYAYVFGHVFDAPIPAYPSFVFAGLLPWTFMALCIGGAPTTVSMEADLVRRSPFPVELLPIASVLSLAVFFLTSLAAWVGWLVVRGHVQVAHLIGIVPATVALLELAAALVLLLGLLDVYNRDIRQVLGNILTVWFFLLPVVYRPSMVPSPLQWMQTGDPMNRIIFLYRETLYSDRLPPFLPALGVVTATTLFLGFALVVFRRYSVEVAKFL